MTAFLSVDIGGTKCAVSIVTADGDVVDRRAIETCSGRKSPAAVLAEIAERGRELLAATPASAVGVSCGGPLDLDAGVILQPPNLPDWVDVPVRAALESAYGLPVRIENDANATALAEHLFGAGRGARNMVFMTMGTGIGAGLILDGRLYRGTNGLAGEVGHQTIVIDGPRCGCGKHGCLEALSSGPAIARTARERAGYGRERSLAALAGGDMRRVTAEHVVRSARTGDPYAIDILAEAGTYLGIGIANVIQVLNPECVVVGTIAVHAGDLVLGPARNAIAEHAWARAGGVCRVVPAALGDAAQDFAGAALWLTDD